MESEEIVESDKEMEEELEMEDEDVGRIQYVEDFEESDLSDIEVQYTLVLCD